MFKKILCLLAVLCLLFTMTACFDSGNGDDTEETTKTSSNSTQNTPTTTDSSATTTDGGSSSGFSEGLDFTQSELGGTIGYKVVGMGTCKDVDVKIPDTYKGPFDREEYPVIEIGDEAFKNCTTMKSIVIPDSVRQYGKSILVGCSSLESITAPFVGGDIYDDDVLGLMFGMQPYTGGVAVEQHTMHGYNSTHEMKTFYIPSSLRSVTVTKDSYHYGTFSGCSFLTSVTINTTKDAHTSLGDYAFQGCSGLTKVNLSCHVKTIGDHAFEGCSKLTQINFISSNLVTVPMLEEIGEYAFSDCTSIEYFTITTLVKKIGDRAFAGCSSLLSIAIPSSVTYVGNRAFDEDCTSLTAIQVLKSQSACSDWDSNWNKSAATPRYN